jgi:hypothetical protein
MNARSEIGKMIQGQASQLSEYLGPWVLDHSRLDSAVLGTPGDQALLDDVVGVIASDGTSAIAQPHDVRDAMHIAWAVRYGFDGFITEDKGLLRRSDEFRAPRFNNIYVMSPATALTVAKRLRRNSEILAERRGAIDRASQPRLRPAPGPSPS